MPNPVHGIRIAELARRSGTSRETIHFYLREGLLRKPKKTSRNMAYYDETHVEELKLIKRLRTESYLPLQVIKKVMKEGRLGTSARQLDLAGELFGQGARTELEPLTQKALAERSGLSERRIQEYEAKGLLRPRESGRQKLYGYDDLRIAELLRLAEEETGPGGEELVLERYEILERHMAELVKAEMKHFFNRIVAEGNPKRVLDVLHGGRETIGRFLATARARRLREEVEAMMPAIEEAIGGAAPERWYEDISDALRERLGEPERRKRLLERFEKSPGDVSAATALFEHLVLIGDTTDAIDLHSRARGAARDEPGVKLLLAEALIDRQHLDQGILLLDQLREGRGRLERPDPMLEALWGAGVLLRLRRDFALLRSSTELIGYLARAFNAFDLARSADTATGLTAARVRLLLGRVSVSTPAFLGAHEQGRKDLVACLEDVEKLRARGDLSYGVLDRLELNARSFLTRVNQT